MKLVTFKSRSGRAHVGIVRDEHILDLAEARTSAGAMPYFDMVELIANMGRWRSIIEEALSMSESALTESSAIVPLDRATLLAPIPRPRKNVLCLGRNYAEHAAESARALGEAKVETPDYPTIFTKSTTSVTGPYADIPYDGSISAEIDWEAELAFVIGRAGKNIKRDDALPYIFGYMVLNDISARDIQRRHGGQFFKGKSLDGACPTGPWLVTADEIPDPNNLEIWTRVNGVEKQHDNTRNMIFDVPRIIEELSLGMTLEPGDIVATGTPEGVGFARQPAEFLHPGDVVECEVETIGVLRNTVS